MSSIAEFERLTIKERTKEGIAIAKAKKKYKGRQFGTTKSKEQYQLEHKEKIAVVQKELNEGKSLNSICENYNYNRPLIYRLIKKGLIDKQIKQKI